MATNVLLLGFTIPATSARQLAEVDSRPAVQTYKFAWSLARAIESGMGKVFLASAFPIQNYPHGRRLVFRGERFTENGIDGVMLGFVNLLVLKHLTRFVSCLLLLPAIIRRHRIDWIVVHGVHTPYLVFGLLARLFGKRLLVMLTDPPGVVLPTDGWISTQLKRLDKHIIRWLLRGADGYMCLSPAMVEHFGLAKPSICFPGILSSKFVGAVNAAGHIPGEVAKGRTVVYAGGLSEAYGVDSLIEAVAGIQFPTVRLVLYGRGDQEQEIIRRASSDGRFLYGGFVGDEQLVPALLAADVLVNPRPAGASFAVLSFPSKLIEYLASGSPVLTTRISSIPQAFRRHFNFIEDSTPEAIRQALLELMEDYEAATQRAVEAKVAVAKELSEAAIGERIAGLVAQIAGSTHKV